MSTNPSRVKVFQLAESLHLEKGLDFNAVRLKVALNKGNMHTRKEESRK